MRPAVPVEVTPTEPPSMAVRVLGMDLLVGPSHVEGNVAVLVALSGNGVVAMQGVPSEGDPVVPAPLRGYSPLAVVRLRRAQAVVQAADIEMIDKAFVTLDDVTD